MPASNDTYVAQWTINQYTATFVHNNGTGATTQKTQDYGTALTAPTLTRTGYTLASWNPAVDSTMQAEDKTYTAQWDINQYTAKFVHNDGTDEFTTTTQDYGSSLLAPNITRTGYTLSSWVPAVPGTMPALEVEDNTYTAQWTGNTYTITFDKQGGEGGDDSKPVTYGDSLPSISTPTRPGYDFKGYYENTNGGGTKYYNVNGTGIGTWDKASSKTLYAYWTPAYVTITFDSNDSNIISI